MPARRVAVVGAGVAGLCSVKECLAAGLEPVCFELRGDLGGIWNYSEDCRDGTGVYECLISNTSKWMTSYSDFPFPPECPPFLTYQTFYTYLKKYAEHFDVIKYIQFKTKVLSITQTNDYDVTGKWNVTTEYAGNVRTETFDCVLVGSGFYTVPRIPEIEGMETFPGTKEHSQTYRHARKYKNKRVLVIGNGSSAGDMAVDISHVAKQVYIDVGNGCWVYSRRDARARSVDLNIRRIVYWFPRAFLNLIIKTKCSKLIDHAQYGFLCRSPPLCAPVMLCEDVVTGLICGKIRVCGRVARFRGNEAVCEDGTVIGDLDSVVFGTGYNCDLSFIKPSVLDANGKMDCYKMIFPLQLSHHTLALIGCMKSFGPSPPVVEMQARVAVRVLTGKLQLPPRHVLRKEVDKVNRNILKEYGRYNYRFENVPYRDELASLIGATPTLWDFLKNPYLAYVFYLTPAFSVHHRLVGVESLDDAFKVCNIARKDIFARQLRKLPKHENRSRWKSVFFVVVAVALGYACYNVAVK